MNLGTRVEFNNVIALRQWSYQADVATVVPPDTELAINWAHPFRKSGHRIYEVGKCLPLFETKGEGKFTRALGLVQLKYYGVEITPVGLETFGEYMIKKVFTEGESKLWLAIYANRL